MYHANIFSTENFTIVLTSPQFLTTNNKLLFVV